MPVLQSSSRARVSRGSPFHSCDTPRKPLETWAWLPTPTCWRPKGLVGSTLWHLWEVPRHMLRVYWDSLGKALRMEHGERIQTYIPEMCSSAVSSRLQNLESSESLEKGGQRWSNTTSAAHELV